MRCGSCLLRRSASWAWRSCSSQRPTACRQNARSSALAACLSSSRHSSICFLKNSSLSNGMAAYQTNTGRPTGRPHSSERNVPSAHPQNPLTGRLNPNSDCELARANPRRLIELFRVLPAGHYAGRRFPRAAAWRYSPRSGAPRRASAAWPRCPLWVTCGRRLGKNFLTKLQHWSGAVTCPAC
jgi:hypothetical protein